MVNSGKNKVSSKAKIDYLEPNEIFGDDNCPVDLSNLTKYINLSVKIPSRVYKEVDSRSNYDTILGGSKYEFNENEKLIEIPLLTTKYLDVSYTEFKDNSEIKNGELFGITSIDISFDVQFFPQVKINFTDVKGLGLMSSLSAIHDKNLKNVTAKAFFTSLFNFPYPVFSLDVKGYYGKTVSFDLSLLDFNTSLKSQTGDVNVSVTFIGNMYGVYADIPMSYLMLAPYLDYEFSYSDSTITKELYGTFWRENSEGFPTYLGLMKKYSNLINGEIKDLNLSGINNFNKKEEEIQNLEEVKKIYDDIIDSCIYCLEHHYATNSIDLSWGNIKTCDDNITLKKGQEKLINLPEFYVDGALISYGILKEKNNSSYKNVSIKEVNPYYEQLRQKVNNEQLFKWELKIEKSIISHSLDYNNYNNNVFIQFKFVDIFNKRNEIQKRIDYLKNENKKYNINEESLNIIKSVLGFDPNLKNFYLLLFKHLNCFTKYFYNHIIKNTTNRTFRSVGLNKGVYETDIPDSYIEKNILPPFPMVSKKNEQGKFELIYPGELEGFKNQSEIKAVERIYNSLKYFNKNQVQVLKNIEMQESGANLYNNGNFLLFGDLIKDIPNSERNYSVLNNSDIYNNDKDIIEGVRDIFLSRLNTFSRIHYVSGDTYSNEYGLNRITSVESTLLTQAYPTLFDINKQQRLQQLRDFGRNNLFGRYKELSGGTDWGFVNYVKGDEKNIIVYDYKKIHKNSIPEASLIILGQGTLSNCENIISVINGDSYKYTIGMDPDDNSVKRNLLTAKSTKESEISIGINNETTSCDLKFIGAKIHKEDRKDYLNGLYSDAKIEITGNVSIQRDDLKFLFNNFYYTDEKSEKIDEVTGFRTSIGVHNIKSSNEFLNKLFIIPLKTLLTVGEYFYWDEKIKKDDPTKELVLSLKGNKSIALALTVSENNIVFKTFCIQLYRKYLGEGNINEMSIVKNFIMPNNLDDYYLILGKSFQNIDTKNIINEDELTKMWDTFVNKISTLYGVSVDSIKEKSIEDRDSLIEKELKTNIYYTLKTLYDKWFAGLNEKIFDLNEDGNEFSKIEYINSTFDDISINNKVNIQSFIKQLTETINNTNNSNSVISYMAKLAQDNNCTFLSVPLSFSNDIKIDEIFGTYNIYDGTISSRKNGVTYIVMLNTDVSHNLEYEDNEYKNDNFSIADYNGDLTDDAATQFVNNTFPVNVKAFGVTYGMQNQNFFKNISVDTTNPSITDYSIINTLAIAKQGNELSSYNTKYNFTNNIFPVYANRSYTCTVDMLGCMNITPLMYFQLNNVPLFRGAYMITNVTHRITPDDFTTTFSGVRVSKYKIPVNRTVINPNILSNISFNDINSHVDDSFVSSEVIVPPTVLRYVVTNNGTDIVNLDYNGNYWVSYSETNDCHASALKIMAKHLNSKKMEYNGGCERVFKLLCEKNNDNKLYYYTYEKRGDELVKISPKNKYEQAIKSIEYHLDNGYPIIVGVNHTFNKINKTTGAILNCPECTTDHFVVIYAYGQMGDGVKYYRYYETGRDIKQYGFYGTDEYVNYFVYVPDDYKPLLYNSSSCRKGGGRYDVTQIRPYIFDKNEIYYLQNCGDVCDVDTNLSVDFS